jgi:hypothetical protein
MSSLLITLKAATRMPFFETDVEGWDYATHGGTVFLVEVEGKPYAITASHVRRDFAWKKLCLTNEKHGREIAGLKAVNYASDLIGDAEGTDFGDITVIEFSEEVTSDFFAHLYPLNAATTGKAEAGDALIAYGCPKQLSEIDEGTIKPIFAVLGFEDTGPHAHDAFLRTAESQWAKPILTSLAGMSGGPVFNTTKDVLSGVMIRGGIKGEHASAKFIDVEDVVRLVGAIRSGKTGLTYRKTVKHPA